MQTIFTFPSTLSVDLSHTAAAETGMVDYGPQTPMNTTTVATAVQRRWAFHTRTVLRADAYGRQRCNVVLSTCSVVYLWCVSWAVCSLERATKPVRTYKVGLIQRNPGNGLIHSRKKKL